MKKTSFLQALVLVILLTGSWMLLFIRMNREPETQPEERPGIPKGLEEQQQPAAQPPPSVSTPGENRKEFPTAPVPPAWKEWIDYITSQSSPTDMRLALAAMRDSLFSLPHEEARARLIELINSGVNVQTGIRFTVGEGGNLSGAADLQTLLLDWLAQLDPQAAAIAGKSALQNAESALGPDAYVVHLKNYARGTPDAGVERNRFVRDYFTRLLENSSWISRPAPSIAESMDFAVFLGDGNLVNKLSQLMAPEMDPGLGHAASMAIERLVDIDPIAAATALMDAMDQPGMAPAARAGFLARLDPADPQAFDLLSDYISQPATSREEAIAFLRFLPNLNKTFSHNLVSPQFSITDLGYHMDRLQSALEAVRGWQSEAVGTALSSELSAAERRLVSQISGIPLP